MIMADATTQQKHKTKTPRKRELKNSLDSYYKKMTFAAYTCV
jgi:hypothetical protein